jgi:hypothetical protein
MRHSFTMPEASLLPSKSDSTERWRPTPSQKSDSPRGAAHFAARFLAPLWAEFAAQRGGDKFVDPLDVVVRKFSKTSDQSRQRIFAPFPGNKVASLKEVADINVQGFREIDERFEARRDRSTFDTAYSFLRQSRHVGQFTLFEISAIAVMTYQPAHLFSQSRHGLNAPHLRRNSRAVASTSIGRQTSCVVRFRIHTSCEL